MIIHILDTLFGTGHLRYEWAVKNNNFEELIQNKSYQFFVLNKDTKNKEQIKLIANKMGLKTKTFEDHEILFKD